MDWKNIGIAAVTYTIISMVVYSLGAFADMSYYADPANSGLWSKVMMPGGGAPGLNFTVLSIIISLITGVIFGSAFVVLRQNFKQKSFVKQGLSFGIFLLILVYVPGFLSMYLLLAIPIGLQLSWMVQGLIVSLAGGVVFATIL